MATTRMTRVQDRSAAMTAGFRRLGAGTRAQIVAARKTAAPRMMDAAVKQLWVDALKSGAYDQGYGELRQKERSASSYCYCALGVLCDIVAPTGFEDHKEGRRIVSCHTIGGKSYQRHHPNQQAMMKIGLYPSMILRISTLNDDRRKSFAEIARFIEKRM